MLMPFAIQWNQHGHNRMKRIELLDQLWNDIQSSQSEDDIERIIQAFHKKTEINPMCDQIESRLVTVKRGPKEPSSGPKTDSNMKL